MNTHTSHDGAEQDQDGTPDESPGERGDLPVSDGAASDGLLDDDAPLDDAARDDGPADEPDDSVSVERDWPVSAAIAVVSAVVALLFLVRCLGSPGTATALDWVLAVVTLAVAGAYTAVVADSRAPLMVLDHHGARIRRGRAWYGVAWPEADRVEHHPRTSLLRDGRLDVVDTDGARYGARLSLSTRLTGADWHELDEALRELSAGRVEVRTPEPAAAGAESETETESVTEALDGVPAPVATDEPAPAGEVESAEPDDQETGVVPVVAAWDAETDTTAVRPIVRGAVEAEVEPTAPATATVSPARDVVAGVRSERVLDRTFAETDEDGAPAEPDHAATIAPADAQETVVVGAAEWAEPTVSVVDPIVGPVLAAARMRIGLTVEQLSDRTRIRPHVIEGIEVDDFAPCGGDFYARGHLRTLARVLGVDVAPLLADYDERYSDLPIDPRRVFEADLATGGAGPMRATRGGLNWSVLVAAVMAVVLVWSVARLVLDHPTPVSHGPVLNGSPSGNRAKLSDAVAKVPVRLTAATGGARVVVRDGTGRTVFSDQLPFEGTTALKVTPPVRITSTDGGLDVSVAGKDEGAIGSTGQKAQKTYVP